MARGPDDEGPRVSRDQDEIEAKAKATADLLLQAVSEPEMLAPAWESCLRVRQDLARRHLALAADTPSVERVNLLVFEVSRLRSVHHHGPRVAQVAETQERAVRG